MFPLIPVLFARYLSAIHAQNTYESREAIGSEEAL